MQRKLILFFVIMNSLHQYSFAQTNQQGKIDSLVSKLSEAKEDVIKLKIYTNILIEYIYFKSAEGLKYEKPALELAEKLNQKEGVALIKEGVGRIYWHLGNFNEALKQHFDALLLYTDAGDEPSAANTLSLIGQDYADGGRYSQALIFFSKALRAFQALGDKNQIARVNNLLSWVYTQQGNYAESVILNFATLKVYEEQGDTDGIAIVSANIAEDYLNLGNYPEAIKYLKKSIKIMPENDKINLAYTYCLLGKVYKTTSDYPAAINNYSTALQMATTIQDNFSIALAYGGLGDVYQAQGNYAEALKNFKMGVEKFKSISNKQELARLYSVMGMCYSKLKMYAEAKKCLDDALVLSNELNSSISFAHYYMGKELLDSSKGNWESAYTNYKHYNVLRDSIFNRDNLNKMLSTQTQYENEKKEAAAKAIQEIKDIRQRTIRNAIAGALAGTLVFLVVVYRQRNKISKARKRSDELLLNILPEEVAEELKVKGSADAKQFDQVTVMFTDFKGFTQISEKLSPKELVEEIHHCFKTFDEIIGKYNIEKIKTIGDAYMCAGGLPVTNTTNAVDVVHAAIEIQQFMQNHLQQRKNENKEPFEIRIGVHTGPVVAGIVGVKKFAYDIWGDTVNIASRMESSGEAGKVNISGSTFELVKDEFTCVYRGQIQAKNKGEIDMYFVEAVA